MWQFSKLKGAASQLLHIGQPCSHLITYVRYMTHNSDSIMGVFTPDLIKQFQIENPGMQK